MKPRMMFSKVTAILYLTLLWSLGIPRLEAEQIRLHEDLQSLAQFRLLSGTLEKSYIVESNSAGVCLFDYDRDGNVDIYLVNGGSLEDFRKGSPGPAQNVLYRNLGSRRFQDVTETTASAGNGFWGMGCSVADYDNDGWLDLYITNYGPNLLYRNEGGKRFRDRTGESGAQDVRWSTGSAWADFDRDGDLDLFVSNYIDLDRQNLPEPGSPLYGSMGGGRLGCQYLGQDVMCGPRGLKGAGDSFFINDGEGRFREAAKEFGLDDPELYYGLGAIWSDLDNDGWLDLYVANDTTPNQLYRNYQGKEFEEVGLLSGTATNAQGLEQAGMGVASGDYLNDGQVGLYVTNFSEDYNSLYRNEGDLNFSDISVRSGTARPSLPYVGWGAAFLDFDNDGWLDLFVANGHVFPKADLIATAAVAPYEQRNLVFRNDGKGSFAEVGESAGVQRAASSRGAAVADLDNDGRLDLVVSNIDDTPTLLWNESANEHHYLILDLRLASDAPAIGARVQVELEGQTLQRDLQAGGSYLSQHDFRLHFGLGSEGKIKRVTVTWPDGTTATRTDAPTDQILIWRKDSP